jgi:hypothetical protein
VLLPEDLSRDCHQKNNQGGATISVSPHFVFSSPTQIYFSRFSGLIAFMLVPVQRPHHSPSISKPQTSHLFLITARLGKDTRGGLPGLGLGLGIAGAEV